MGALFDYICSGITLGSIYALIAVGIVIVFKATSVFNFSQGYLVMVGMFISLLTIELLGLILGIVVAVVIMGIIGVIIERLTLRRLIGQPLITCALMTLALCYLLHGIASLSWGPHLRAYPDFFHGETLSLGPAEIPLESLCYLLITLACFGLLGIFYQRSKLGKLMRAAADSHEVSQSLGIRVRRIFSISWGIMGMVCVLPAVFLGSVGGAHTMMSEFGFRAMPAVIIGGMDSIAGALIAGLTVGLVETLGVGYLGPALGQCLPFIIMLTMVLIKPYGLFGLVRIERI